MAKKKAFRKTKPSKPAKLPKPQYKFPVPKFPKPPHIQVPSHGVRPRDQRAIFYKYFTAIGQAYKPVAVAPRTGTLFSRRNVQLAIREGAVTRRKIRLLYWTVQYNTYGIYLVEPYSFRYRKTRIGWRRVLFAYDRFPGTIKMFLIGRILNIQVTTEHFAPRWRVEIR